MKRILAAALMALMLLSNQAHATRSLVSGLGNFPGSNAWFLGPQGASFSIVSSFEDTDGSLVQRAEVSLAIGNDFSHAFAFWVDDSFAEGARAIFTGWIEPTAQRPDQISITAPVATFTFDQESETPGAPNFYSPVLAVKSLSVIFVEITDYKPGILGACVGGLSQCLYSEDPGRFKFQIDLVTPVPESPTYALMAIGLAGIGWVARKRRH